MTAPRFLGHQFNPVSFWYLYGVDRHLTALVVEVNNTFDERRMYFLTAKDGGKHSRRTSSRRCTFKQSWPKDFHVSPFNSRKGTYTITATDPLHPSMQGTGPVSITINLASTKGHTKLVTKLTSQDIPIDPCTMTRPQRLRFLTSWAWVGLLTYPRILVQAFRLYFHRRLRVWPRPEPLRGTIPRRATAAEQQVLEPLFRRYLHHLVQHTPLTILYTPAAGGTSATEVMLPSPLAATTTILDMHILTPAFYSNFVRDPAALDAAFLAELREGKTLSLRSLSLAPDGADNNDLSELLQQHGPRLAARQGLAAAKGSVECRVLYALIRWLRGGAGGGALDGYVLAEEAVGVQMDYGRCVLGVLVAERVWWLLVVVLVRVGVVVGVVLGVEAACGRIAFR